jgi:hypothetical protein
MITRMPGLISWRGLSLAAVVALCLAQLAPWTRSAGRDAAAHQPDCAVWDRAASEGIATLISDTSAATESRLDEAILQLRRARKSCRSGAIALARHDYASLHQTFPTSTGPLRANSDTAHGHTALPVTSVSDPLEGAGARRSRSSADTGSAR